MNVHPSPQFFQCFCRLNFSSIELSFWFLLFLLSSQFQLRNVGIHKNCQNTFSDWSKVKNTRFFVRSRVGKNAKLESSWRIYYQSQYNWGEGGGGWIALNCIFVTGVSLTKYWNSFGSSFIDFTVHFQYIAMVQWRIFYFLHYKECIRFKSSRFCRVAVFYFNNILGHSKQIIMISSF